MDVEIVDRDIVFPIQDADRVPVEFRIPCVAKLAVAVAIPSALDGQRIAL